MRLRIDVTRRQGVADPEATTVVGALRELGFSTVTHLEVGRTFIIDLDEVDPDAARTTATQMCERLLANPVIEDYAVHVLAEDPAS